MPIRLAAAAAAALCAVALAGAALAQETRFSGQLDIYSLAVPPGWAQQPHNNNVDAAFASPEGPSKGSFYVGLQNAQPSLEAEFGQLDRDSSWGRRSLMVDGVPCLTEQASQGIARNNLLSCHVTVQFRDGPMVLNFFMGSASIDRRFSEDTDTFFRAVDSVRWGQGVSP